LANILKRNSVNNIIYVDFFKNNLLWIGLDNIMLAKESDW